MKISTKIGLVLFMLGVALFLLWGVTSWATINLETRGSDYSFMYIHLLFAVILMTTGCSLFVWSDDDVISK
jgi:low temperature requirement protein LtrA